jgi:hypothetical protein
MWYLSYPARVKLGIALLLLVVLNSTIRASISTLFHSHNLTKTHYIAQYERRFVKLQHVSSTNQFIFYVDDFDRSSDQCDAFYLTQYALAPAILVTFDSSCGSAAIPPTRGPRLIVENFHDPEEDSYLLGLFPSKYFAPQTRNDQFIASVHNVPITNFGDGLRVFTVPDK